MRAGMLGKISCSGWSVCHSLTFLGTTFGGSIFWGALYKGMASIRKTYIDSRFGIGPPNDFTVELPLQITTTKEQGLVLGQFSIPNVFGSVIAGYNDRLYWRVDGMDTPRAIRTGVNDRFYWGWGDGQQYGVITTLPSGTYTDH